MKKLLVLAILASTTALAEPRFYTEYKNELNFRDEHYIDDSARNSLRVGAQGEIFYLEVGPSERNDKAGFSFETGYKYKFCDPVEIKGKLEGFQFDNYEGRTDSKFETEVRYYFN